ncbi:MAG: 2-dehydropantoate 2-reductase N-terminal domain-containing protein [Candidatus Bathyarchaeia archaeon]
MREEPRVVVVGAGAIGSSIAGWIAPKYGNLSLLARGETLEVIKNRGLKSYLKGGRLTAAALPVHGIGSLVEIALPDVIVITVKNYDLDTTSHGLRAHLGDHEPIVVALQNGVQNQQVLPRYFGRVVYGVVCYNAWRDGPGEVGHEPRGYVILGTPANDLQDEAQAVARIFGLGLDCVTTDRLQDAVHCKLVINLANALMTLVGFQRRPIGSFNLLVRMTLKLFWEGIQLLQAAGFHEHSLGPIPSWRSIKMGATLPAFMMGALYRLNTKRLGLNSMAQDVFGGRTTTELETLNGYMLDLARRAGFSTPINETIYEVAKERFGPNFQPISEQELWGMIERKVRRMKSKGNLQSTARSLQSLACF